MRFYKKQIRRFKKLLNNYKKEIVKFFKQKNIVIFKNIITVLVIIVVFIGFITVLYLGVKQLKFEIQKNIKEGLVNKISEEQVVKDLKKELVYSSFTDLFSGIGWLDKSKTNMHHDQVTTAFTFPPKYLWNKIDGLSISSDLKMDEGFNKEGSFISCINGKCLIKDEFNLYFISREDVDNYKNSVYRINLPENIKNRNLVSMTIGELESQWLVGVVSQEGGNYFGNVYKIIPTTNTTGSMGRFENIFQGDNLFTSKYNGKIGFGGIDEDFIIIYGGYEGQAYRFLDGSLIDLSKFFGIRVMEKRGFYPDVIRKTGKDKSGVIWYVWSRTEGIPKLLKLFENGTGNIVGSIDLSKFLFGSDTAFARFYPGGNSLKLRSEIEVYGGNKEYWEFEDLGFNKEKDLEIVSSNISNYPAKVIGGTFKEGDLYFNKDNTSFYLSNDLENWVEVEQNQEIIFSDFEQRRLFWKARFRADKNNWTSPYIDTIKINYFVEFL